ncbi:hypothetical protein ASD62_03690 [Phycicoccus sp. Root563]|uniref:cytochrome P450 n=1 Tax=Phycicoccus sp. Root563 TaxID=1736562 RepID=UPI0007030133|nr:cytochrome P450 [Phycicoccus sp. Root563]KQZ88548.1 hypothetical protein ASD62_03690 [Phycicoccus sp. Root563]
MSDEVQDPALEAERALMGALFSPDGRSDPAATARSVPVAGCSYAFVTEALHDRRLMATPIPPSDDLMFQVAARFMSRVDGERHTASRKAFSGLFSPRRVERYRAQIQATAAELLEALPATGPVDIVTTFAHPLPFAVICQVLGVPKSQQPWLAERMDTFGRGVAGQRDRANIDAGNAAASEMLAFFDDLLGHRQLHPEGDLLTLLGASAASDGAHEYLLANCIFFVLAGHATTTSLLTAGVHVLSSHPHHVTDLQEDPAGWMPAVEELLRLVSPTTLTGVTATADVQIASCEVPAGANRAVVFAAANRDPSTFTDPDTFDPTRTPNPHVSFSAGVHYCLGAPLARLHAEVALPMLFGCLPGLRTIGDPTWLGSVPIRQVASLEIDWDAHRQAPAASPLRPG